MYEVLTTTKEGIKTEYAYSLEEFRGVELTASPLWGHSSKRKDGSTMYDVINKPVTFDIETSTIKKKGQKNNDFEYESFMYIFQFCVEGKVVFGRTWDDFTEVLEILKNKYDLSPNKKLVIYVHNLGYEYMFIKDFLGILEVFAMDAHKVAKIVTNFFEFRCSYILSNKSLEKYIETTEGTFHLKAAGDLDYNILRTPTTVLNKVELGYCYNDVLGLYEALLSDLKEDTLKTIPLTSTGYVRRIARAKMQSNKENFKNLQKTALSMDLLLEMREAFRGGNTASNRYRTNYIIEQADFKVGGKDHNLRIKSYDISSSYPYAMLLPEYPIGKFMEYTIYEGFNELEQLNKEYCTIGRYYFENLRLKENVEVPVPYLPFSKSKIFKTGEKGQKSFEAYNGRILRADALETTLTNIDYEIIKEQYDFDGLKVKDFYISRKGYLPKELRECVLYFFKNKSLLKDVEGKEYEYGKTKALLNALYGMLVTWIIYEVNYEDNEGVWRSYLEKSPEEQLKEYYENKTNFLSYQWGVWVTAVARYRLQEMLNAVGNDVIYCDTDSVKFIDIDNENEQKFIDKNRQTIKENLDRNLEHSIEVNGKVFYLGTWDREPDYLQFITLGAKKYAFKKLNKKGQEIIGITVAGLSKTKGAEELTKSGGLESFKDGKIFTDAGRTTAKYNTTGIHTININGENIKTASNISLVEVPYTLGITTEMLDIIDSLDIDTISYIFGGK